MYSVAPKLSARRPGLGKAALLILKFAITIGCLCYIFWRINFHDLFRVATLLDFRWLSTAVLCGVLQVPLAGLRWCKIVNGLETAGHRVPRAPMISITAITSFLYSVLPNVFGEAFRVWMLVRLGRNWRQGVTSVLIDRGIAVAVLFILAFALLFLPSALVALGEHRTMVIEVFGVVAGIALIGFLLIPRIAPILLLWRYSRWVGVFANATYSVIFRTPTGITIVGLALLVHLISILCVYSLARAQGLPLPAPDAAVLFVVMVAIAILPISIGGWGLRELAVTSLLGAHGVAVERALFFSISFGIVLIISSLLGAAMWVAYLPSPAAEFRTQV